MGAILSVLVLSLLSPSKGEGRGSLESSLGFRARRPAMSPPS
jgi:hypothetical protein